MFKEITITSSQNLKCILGQIAESLLFYEKTNLVCSPPFFIELIKLGELDSFVELMKLGKINVYLEDNIVAFQTREIQNSDWHRVGLVKTNDVTIRDRLNKVITNTTQRKGYSKRIVKKIIDNSSVYLHDTETLKYIDEDLDDEVYLKRAISQAVYNFNPNLIVASENIQPKITRIQNGFVLKTNLNLDLLNQSSPKEKLNSRALISNLITARLSVMTAAKLNSDLSASPRATLLLKEKINVIIQKSTQNKNQIKNFSELIIPDGKTISGVINSGEKKLSEFFKILEKADKIKTWIKNIQDDESLIREYHKAVTKDTWADKLPNKVYKWSFFSGAGMLVDLLGAGGIGTLSSLGISAADAFLLDKITKGWKPNLFVDKELKEFIRK